MSKEISPLNEIEVYISEKKKRQYQKNLKRAAAGVFIILVLAASSFFVISNLNQSTASDGNLTQEEFLSLTDSMLTGDAIVVSGESTTLPYAEASQQKNLTLPSSPFKGLDIAGDRSVGKTLTFSIIGNKSGFKYKLDLGNGIVKTINQSYKFRYKNAGTFLVKLYVDQDKYEEFEYSIPIEIAGKDVQFATNANRAETNGVNKEIESEALSSDSETITPEVKSTIPSDSGLLASSEENIPELAVTDLRGISNNPSEPSDDSNSNQREREELSTEEETVNKEAVTSKNTGEEALRGKFEKPSFPGGRPALAQFIQGNLQYPRRAWNQKIEGTVVATFNVAKDGSLTNVKIVKGIEATCDEEVLRIIARMPKWEAATLNGNPVNFDCILPIKFQLVD